MSLNDNKISAFTSPVVNMPDSPSQEGYSAADIKAWFDSNTTAECKTSINGIVDTLTASTGAGEIGALDSGLNATTVQGALNLKSDLINNHTLESALDDSDEIAFYDASAASERKTIWSNIKALLKAYFDPIYAAIVHTHTLSDITDVTAASSEINLLDGVTATTAELNILDGVTATTAELNILDGVTATAGDINSTVANAHTHANKAVLDGITGVTAVLGTAVNKVPSERAVSDAISASGGGDMMKSIYDTGNAATDIFTYADGKIAKVAAATSGNMAQFAEGGSLSDSGLAFSVVDGVLRITY